MYGIWRASRFIGSSGSSVIDSILADSNEFVTTYKGKVSSLSPTDINTAIKTMEDIKSRLYQLSQFAHLNYAVDIQDVSVLKFVSKIDEFSSTIANTLLFFFLEIGQISTDVMNQWIDDPINEDYVYSITQAVKKNRYRLTEQEEQLINIKDLNGVDAFRKLYGEHTSRYEFTLTVDGEENNEWHRGRALRYHNDPDVRRNAMKLFYARIKKMLILCLICLIR